jgi:membrane protein DedA with SNARE-associated domain
VTQFLTDVVARHGYVAVLVLMAMSTACIPVPSEIVLMFGGALASETFAATALDGGAQPLNLVWVIVVATIGTLIGAWVAYGIGAAGGRPLVDRAGKWLLFRPDEVDKAHVWFDRHGDAAVLFARVIPVVRAFISLPAGVARMKAWRFTLYTLIGALTWDVGFAVAGYYLGESWRTVEKYIRPISIAIGVLLAGLVTWWVVKRLRARKALRGAAASGATDGDGRAPGAVADDAAPTPEIASASAPRSSSADREA